MSESNRRDVSLPRSITRVLMCLLVGVSLFFEFALIAAADDVTKAYARRIEEIQADLDAGRVADATQKLAATDESHRSFEFQYLSARAGNAKEGTAAADGIRKLAKPDVETRYGVLNPMKSEVVFICRDGSLRVYDLSSADAALAVLKHSNDSAVFTGAFSHDCKRFFSGHQNGDVIVRDTATWEIVHTIPLGENWPVRELAVSPDGSSFVAESKPELQLWSLAEESPKKIAAIGKRYNFGEGLAFSPTGNLIATGGMFDIILHDAQTGDEIRTMSHASYTMGLEFSPDGKLIASAPRGNVNKFLAIFDVNQDKPLFNAGPFRNYVAGLAFTPDGKRIVATGCENVVRIFDTTTGEITLSLKRTECSAKPAVSRDGHLLGWNEPEGFLYIDLGTVTKATH